MERDPINGLVRGSYQIIHGPRGAGNRHPTGYHSLSSGDHPPPLQGRMVSDLRKHTLATYFKDHQEKPRQNLRWLILVKEKASDEQGTHMRVWKTRDGFLLLDVGTTKGPDRLQLKRVVTHCQSPIRKPYGRQSPLASGGIIAQLQIGTTVQDSPDAVSSGSASCLKSRNSASLSSDSGTKHIS